jgi:hypothetical protein
LELLWSIVLAVTLVLAAAGLMIWHVRAWRSADKQPISSEERDYRRRQFRRRMQTSAMLGVIAASLPAGVVVMRQWPKVGAFYWGGVLLLVGWVGLLALADMWATRHYYGRIRRDYAIEQARLQAELNRIQEIRGNGKARRRRDRKRPSTQDEGK